MKKKLQKRLEVYENTIASLDKHLSVWQHVKAMTRTHDRFVRNFKKLTDHKSVLDQDLKSMKDKHLRIHRELADRIIPVMGVISVYAADIGNKALMKQFSVKDRHVHEMKDLQLLRLSETILSLKAKDPKGKSESLNPVDYGLTNYMTERIRTKSEELKGSLKSGRKARKEVKKTKEAVKRLIKRNDKLLRTRTDKFVQLFSKSNKAFFRDYRQARKNRSDKAEATSVTSRPAPKPKAASKQKAVSKQKAESKQKAVSSPAVKTEAKPTKADPVPKTEPDLERAESA